MKVSPFFLDAGPTVFMQATYSISLTVVASELASKDISLGLTAL